MKVSVLIPAYNAAKTIDATLKSVLTQSFKPMEIVVLDDGSTDDTANRLLPYQPAITVFRRPNVGLAQARNFLLSQAKGDIIAFIDSDDLWHPQYLEIQCGELVENPEAVASYSKYIGFREPTETTDWLKSNLITTSDLLEPATFFRRYNDAPDNFLLSFCCIRKSILGKLKGSHFPTTIKFAEDIYFANLLTLLGPVLHLSPALGAYRFSPGSLSSNRTRIVGISISVFELVIETYRSDFKNRFGGLVGLALAARKRHYAKFLMGSASVPEARVQLLSSFRATRNWPSRIKSLGLYLVTYLPRIAQPRWPDQDRDKK